MATRTLSIPLFIGGGSTLTGPTVDVGDTITVTVTAAGSSGTAASSNVSGCSVISNVTLGTATANAVTNFSGTTYSFRFIHTVLNPLTTYYRDVTGTINNATPDPDAFNLGDTSGTISGTSYNSNTITLAGLNSGQSVTVSVSSDSSTYGYYKNGTLVANAANTTGENDDQFYVSHVSKTGQTSVTSTSLTAGGTSDTFTTTNGNPAGTIWTVGKTSPSGTPNEGDTIGMAVNAPLGEDENFWWSVSPTDVDASTGSGTTSNNPATKGVPAYNLGGFNFTPDIDYTDDAAAGTGPYDYTVNVYDDSGLTNLVATTTVAVNDSSQPLPPDSTINAIGNQTLAYAAGSNNGHSITIGGADDNNSYYDVVIDGTTSPVYGTEIGNGTLEVADDNISPGNQTTFRVYARRPVANNGDNSYYNTNRTYTISRRAQTPSISAALASNPDDDDVTINWTISNGDGGTLEYSTDNTNWTAGTSFAQAAKRGTEYTLYARTNATVVSITATATFTPGYNDPDASIDAITSPNQDYGTTTYVVPIANGSSIDEYFVYNNAGTVSYGGRTGDGNITITHGVAAGGVATFRVYARRPVEVGGDNGFDDTGTTFVVRVYPNATSISASDDNAEATSVLVTLSATGGEGGTIEYAKFSYSATTEYEQNRNTTVTYYSRSRGPNGLLSTVSSIDYYVGYIDPDASIDAITSPNQDYGTTTYVVPIANGYASDEYYVYNNAGTVSYGGRTGDGNIPITHGVAAGGAATFRVYTRKPLAVGGDNGFDDTGRTFEVEVYPQTPSGLTTFTDGETEAASGTFTIAVGGLDGASSTTITLSSDYTTNAVANGSAIASVARAGDIIYARNTGANGLTASAGIATPATYLDPATVASGNLIRNGDQDTHTISTGSAANYLLYRVLSIGVERGSAAGGTDITVTDVTLPGSNLTHTIQGKRETTEGGDGAWKSLDTYVIIKRPGPPTTIGLGNDPGTEASEALFTVTASGSLDDDAVYTVSTDNNSWANNVSELLLTRVSDTIYARATGENGQISGASFAVTVPHLNPKSFSISNNDTEVIAAGTTQFAAGISGADTDHSYRILYGVTTPVTLADERTTDGNLIVDGAGIPNKGNDMNYAIQVKRGLDSGGNNQWVQTSTFTKKRSIDDPIITVFDDEAASPTVLVTVESSAVSNVTGDADAYQAQGDPDADGTFTSYENMDGNRRKTYSQLRNQSLADYRVKAKGANDTETTATLTNYDPGYLEPFKNVTLTSNTLIVPQADTTATVVVNNVENSTDVVSVRANNGSTDLATETPTGGTATISFDHGLAIGGSSTFEIFIKRDTDTGGDGSTFYQTNVTFTVERVDTTSDPISFGADITTAARGSVHYASTQVTGITTSVTVSSAGGSSIPFFVSSSATASTTATDYNNNAKTANNNDYIHLRAVASTNYSTQKLVTISVGDPAQSDTWRVTTLASASPFDLGEPSESPSRINTVYTSNIITVAGLDTGQTSAATVTGGEFRKNSGAWRTAAETVQNDDTLQVRGTSAETYDGTTVDVTLNLEGRSDTFSITTETKPTIPTGISITNDTTTPSDVVSLSCTAEGGSGGTLRISEDDNTYDADATANFNFTRGSAKTLYAKRFGTFINSDLFTRAAFTLAYIPATTGITATPTSPASSNIDMQVVISNGNSLETYSVYNSSKTTLLGFRTGNGTITFTDASLQDNNTNTYAVQVRRDVNVGGNGNLVDTGVTFDIAYDSNVANVPPSISVSASSYTPAINTSVDLTATATDTDGSISSIAWTQLSGPTTTPSPTSNANSNSLTSTITTPNSPTTLRYKATATDNASASTDSSILEIQVAGGSDYGFEVYNASGNTILSVNSTVPRIVAAGNAGQLDFSAGNTYTQNVSVAGMSNDGTWEVLIYTPYLALAVAHEVTISSGQFTITTVVQSNGGTGSLTIYYYVLRI